MFTSPPTDALHRAAPGLPVVLYDGACAFCVAQAERVRRLGRGRVRVRPLQDALDELPWLDPEALVRALHLVDRDGRAYAGAAAIVRLLRLTRPWLTPLLVAYHAPGVRQLADAAYAFVAARRYRIAGRTDDACASGACGMPSRDRDGARGTRGVSRGGRDGAGPATAVDHGRG